MAKEVKQDKDGWVLIPWSKRPSKIIVKNGKLYLITKDWEDDDLPNNVSDGERGEK